MYNFFVQNMDCLKLSISYCQVANGFIVGNDHKMHFLALILNVL